ncbi:hypothetical protein NDU88_003422 [Pleurodeles waltl]|uniref:Uncharacterized protein n=1 Tax=Pleurodeles waltl TaxID=8319 RepID=A0AAV7V004_PLEWA|nr:hypothetical protein NDU88_003422 [Pleurodeles waltl]
MGRQSRTIKGPAKNTYRGRDSRRREGREAHEKDIGRCGRRIGISRGGMDTAHKNFQEKHNSLRRRAAQTVSLECRMAGTLGAAAWPAKGQHQADTALAAWAGPEGVLHRSQ